MDYISWSAVRSIPTKEKGNRGFFPSKKVPEGIVEYESQLERDFFLLCEHNPSVKRFQHQPITITYKSEKGKYVTYTPDPNWSMHDPFFEFCIKSLLYTTISKI